MNALLLATSLVIAQPPLNGAFIQYDKDVLTKMAAEDWDRVLVRMKGLGMKIVILQFLGSARDDGAKPPGFLSDMYDLKFDPTRAILESAAKLEMDVYIGLLEPPKVPGTDISTNAKPGYWNKGNLTTFATANSTFADEVWKRYGLCTAFKGWYIPLENWVGLFKFDPINAWADFYSTVAKGCRDASKKKPGLKVAISPCLPSRDKDPAKSYRTSPEEAVPIFAGMLDTAGVDIVMLQDGIGEHSNGPPPYVPLTIEQAASYLAPMQKACKARGVEFWSNIESFETPDGSHRSPCQFGRLKEQLVASRDVTTKVTFEFLKYLNSEPLYQNYKANCVNKNCVNP